MNIFVSNISFHTTESILQDLFSKHGIVKSVKIIMDKLTGRSRGFGFVEMQSFEEGQIAITALNNKEIEGRMLNVAVAKPSSQRADRFENKW